MVQQGLSFIQQLPAAELRAETKAAVEDVLGLKIGKPERLLSQLRHGVMAIPRGSDCLTYLVPPFMET